MFIEIFRENFKKCNILIVYLKVYLDGRFFVVSNKIVFSC